MSPIIRECDARGLAYFVLHTGQHYSEKMDEIFFKDCKDLVLKIRYYLEHEKEREAIALVGHKRTVKEHTYERRFNGIFKIIGLKNA